MNHSKPEPEKCELEIVYDVQWKTPGNDDDKAKIIGIIDTPDTNLDWNTFKSYLIQNSGNMRFTTDDIRISYLDSDDDLIPVDSEIEFRECLKFSRIRARRGRKIMMKVNMISNNGVKPKGPTKNSYNNDPKHGNPKLFCLKKKDMKDRLIPKIPLATRSPVTSKSSPESKDETPEWFDKYMTKFKAELIDDITSVVVSNLRSAVLSAPVRTNIMEGSASHSRGRTVVDLPQPGGSATVKNHHHHHHLSHVIEKRKKKKKMPEEDSSDCTDGLQLQWEEKLELLRHMQKVNKREKKFEKKLDAKLEKLESKTKKIMEKKHTLWNSKKCSGVAASSQNPIPVAPAPFHLPSSVACELVMDATPVDEYNYVPHAFRGDLVHQVWKVMNDGQMDWTDETELRFAWGSKSLVPLTSVVKCPLLKPGEIGKIKVTLQAPMFPGNFECYWHFHHQGRRFGHWLGCGVIVDPDPRPDTPVTSETNKPPENCDHGSLPVDLTMKCHPEYDTKASTTDDMKIYNIETKPENCTTDKHEPEKEIDCVQKTEQRKESTLPTSNMASEVGHCIIDTELEEFPTLESYTSLNKPPLNFVADSFPDLVQRNDDLISRPDLSSWAQYLPHGASNNVDVADLLNIQNDLVCLSKSQAEQMLGLNKNDGQNSGDKYEKIITGVKDMSIHDDAGRKDADDKSSNIAEYASGSDSDNISIISGTISVDSDDTEPSEEYVVVPMPTCENSDAYENQEASCSLPVTEPISVEIPKSSSDSDISAEAIQTSDNNNNMELKPFPPRPLICLDTMIDPVPAQVATLEEPKVSDDENTVYIKDSFGKSVPVAIVIKPKPGPAEEKPSPNSADHQNIGFSHCSGIRHSTFGDPSFGQGPTGPRFPFIYGSDPLSSPPHCHNPGGPCNFKPQHDSPTCTTKFAANVSANVEGCAQDKTHSCYSENQQGIPCSQESVHCPYQVQTAYEAYPNQEMPAESITPTAPPHTYRNIHTEQPRSCKYRYVYNSGSNENISTSSAFGSSSTNSGRRSSDSRQTSPVAAAVQILPETLVTGAVNVASSAISTARSVIDMLRPRHEEPVIAHWDQIPPAMENNLRVLSEMGFNNRELNIILLSQNNNDLTRVISELVQ